MNVVGIVDQKSIKKLQIKHKGIFKVYASDLYMIIGVKWLAKSQEVILVSTERAWEALQDGHSICVKEKARFKGGINIVFLTFNVI